MQFGNEFFRSNFTYIAEIYEKYKLNPSSVDASWKEFFQNLSEDDKSIVEELNYEQSSVIGQRNELSSLPKSEINDILKKENENLKQKKTAIEIAKKEGIMRNENSLNTQAVNLASNYRNFGHLICNLDPLSLMEVPFVEELNFEFSQEDMEEEVSAFNFIGKLKDCISFFKKTYGSEIGIESSHVKNLVERKWIYEQCESFSKNSISKQSYIHSLEMMLKAEIFENTLHLKFPGAKRFSAEGGEAAIASLEQIFLTSSDQNVDNVVIGMAHRGRLNVLTQILEKPYHALFSEFMGISSIPEGVPGSGDVKYHLGLDKVRTLQNGKKIQVSLTPNPSHLESVNPVVMGRVRSKQDNLTEDKLISLKIR